MNAAVQYNNKIAWQEQQSIWNELFLLAPDIQDDTFILFILPGFEDRTGFVNWKRTPLSASWEASSGIRLFYDNPTLTADVYFPDIDEPIEPELTTVGVATQETGMLSPYTKVIAFEYDNISQTLSRLNEIPSEYISGADEPASLCQSCILREDELVVPLRQTLLGE